MNTRDGLFITNESGQEEFIPYSDLDRELLPQLLKPVGGFIYGADAFMSLPFTKTPFYIEGWLPKQGRLLLYAPAKSGKSILAVQIARCIAAGESFLGMPTEQGRTLYVQAELGVEVLQGRLKMTGKAYPDVYVGTSFALKLDDKNSQDSLRKAMDAVEPQVLIIDGFYKMIKGDENESQDMMRIIDFLDELIFAYKCSVVIIHHPGKDLRKGSRGSSVLEDYPDSVIEMKRVSGDEDKNVLKVKLTPKFLRHASLPPEPLSATMVGFEFQLDREDTLKEAILRFVSVQRKTEEILDNIPAPARTVYLALHELLEEKKLKQPKRGMYDKI